MQTTPSRDAVWGKVFISIKYETGYYYTTSNEKDRTVKTVSNSQWLTGVCGTHWHQTFPPIAGKLFQYIGYCISFKCLALYVKLVHNSCPAFNVTCINIQCVSV